MGLLPLLTLIRLALKGYSEILKGCPLPASHCAMFAETFASVCASENSSGCFQESKATSEPLRTQPRAAALEVCAVGAGWGDTPVSRVSGFSPGPYLNNSL